MYNDASRGRFLPFRLWHSLDRSVFLMCSPDGAWHATVMAWDYATGHGYLEVCSGGVDAKLCALDPLTACRRPGGFQRAYS